MSSLSVTEPARGFEPVAVVLPCHDYGRFVHEAIESALSQQGVTVEVIVVDDGSTDNTREVVTRYPSVRYAYQPCSGPSAARNRGLAETEAPFVVFLDADDRLLPEALRSSLDELRAHPECAFAFGRHRYVAADGRPISTPPAPRVDGDLYRAMLRGEDHPVHTPGVVVYRRDAVARVGGFDRDLTATADLDLNLRIVREAPACFNDRIVLDYRMHDSNMISRPAFMLEQSLAALSRQRDYVRAHPQYRPDYEFGLELTRHYFGTRLARAAWVSLRGGSVRAGLRDLAVLIRCDPRGSLRYALRGSRHLARRILARVSARS